MAGKTKRSVGDEVWMLCNGRITRATIGSIRADGWCWVRWWTSPRKGYTQIVPPSGLYNTKEELQEMIGL